MTTPEEQRHPIRTLTLTLRAHLVKVGCLTKSDPQLQYNPNREVSEILRETVKMNPKIPMEAQRA